MTQRTEHRTVYTLSERETFELGKSMAHGLRRGVLMLLEGELGAGKTVFARGVAAGLGIPEENVSSPTFTFVQEYTGGRMPIFHVDLYRLELSDDMGSLGIEEILQAGGVVLVEWADKLPASLRRGGVVVRFHEVGEGARRIEIAAESPTAQEPSEADA